MWITASQITTMDKDKLWRKISQELKDELSSASFRTWFSGVSISKVAKGCVTFATPSGFIQENIKSRYLKLLESSLEKALGNKVTVEFTVVPGTAKPKALEQEEGLFIPDYTPTSIPTVNPKYTLQNFVVGLSNNVAYAAAQAVSQNPGTSYNPLFLYGSTGVGKTHLMLAIGNTILARNPNYKVIYCSSEKFMNDYVGAIQNRKMGDLRNKYRSAHILLIDDIQFFSGREGTQEEFFHTFNELQGKNAQIVITSDRPPHEIAKIEDRLKSRFAGGLMVDIQPPDFDTRVAILKAKCLERGESLPEDSLKLIASSMQTNIRELEGKLIQIIQLLRTQNLPPTVENISGHLNQQVSRLPSDHKQILSAICRFFDLNLKDLTGPKRQKELVLPRHITMYLLSEELGMTVEKIGQVLGGRDHTTVMHGRDRIKGALDKDMDVQKLVGDVKKALTS